MTLAATPAPPARQFAPADFGLYAGTVLVWSTTWLALKFQLGAVDPQVSIVWRFLIAAPLMFLVCRLAGAPHPLSASDASALRGARPLPLLDQLHPLLQRRALRRVRACSPSSSRSPRSPTSRSPCSFSASRCGRACCSAQLLGLAGVTLMLWHEIDWNALGAGPLIGLALGLLGCLSFSIGNMISARIQRDGIPVLSANAWGVSYGVLVNVAVALVAGSAFIIEPTTRYVAEPAVARHPGLGARLLDVPRRCSGASAPTARPTRPCSRRCWRWSSPRSSRTTAGRRSR